MADSDPCPWCGMPQNPQAQQRSIAAALADELEQQGQAWQSRSDLDGSPWFAEGIKFAAVWLRSI